MADRRRSVPELPRTEWHDSTASGASLTRPSAAHVTTVPLADCGMTRAWNTCRGDEGRGQAGPAGRAGGQRQLARAGLVGQAAGPQARQHRPGRVCATPHSVQEKLRQHAVQASAAGACGPSCGPSCAACITRPAPPWLPPPRCCGARCGTGAPCCPAASPRSKSVGVGAPQRDRQGKWSGAAAAVGGTWLAHAGLARSEPLRADSAGPLHAWRQQTCMSSLPLTSSCPSGEKCTVLTQPAEGCAQGHSAHSWTGIR